MRRVVGHPNSGYGRTKVSRTPSKLGRLMRGTPEKPGGGIDIGVRVRRGRR